MFGKCERRPPFDSQHRRSEKSGAVPKPPDSPRSLSRWIRFPDSLGLWRPTPTILGSFVDRRFNSANPSASFLITDVRDREYVFLHHPNRHDFTRVHQIPYLFGVQLRASMMFFDSALTRNPASQYDMSGRAISGG